MGRDPALRTLVVRSCALGSTRPPSSDPPVVRGVLPGIDADDRLLLWGGGIWNWFDPLTVPRASGGYRIPGAT